METTEAIAIPRQGANRDEVGRPMQLRGRLAEVAQGYQRMLTENPQNPEALIGMSLIALASRQTDAAIRMATAGVSVASGSCTAWVALGQTLKAAERFEEAEEAYRQAIRIDGMNPLAHMGIGELKIALNRPLDAIAEYRLVLLKHPEMVAAHMGLGSALAYMGNNSEALQRYEAALALHPRLPEGEFAAGFVLVRMGRLKEAETRYRRALSARPDFAAAWTNMGGLLREMGQDLYAEAALRRAIELRPDLASGWVNLAILERTQGRIPQAEAHLLKAFALNPCQVETLVAWCQFRAAQKDLAGAWQWLRWALARNPESDEAMNMQGILLHLEGRYSEAVETFRRAEELGSCPASSNRGNSLLDLGRMDEALRAQETAVERDPHNPGALYNLALTQLRMGLWEQGWPAYEARWQFREVHRFPMNFQQPRWRGEQLNGERVLLHAEQGLGDTIQFCRYAALVAARGGRPILQVQAGVKRLMQSLAVVRAGQADLAELGTEPQPFDLECPLLSLPAVFGTTTGTVPWNGAYLGADPELATQKRDRFTSVRTGLRVGISWAGNPRYKADRRRSTRVETLLPLFRAVDATWISLQKGEPAEQLAGLPDDVFVWDGSSREQDLFETAALIAGLDMVITTDTCIAHLAGAMGKPVWILLPHLADWRWMEKIETTPWYPSARLFRQQAPGDWASVVGRVIQSLQGMALLDLHRN